MLQIPRKENILVALILLIVLTHTLGLAFKSLSAKSELFLVWASARVNASGIPPVSAFYAPNEANVNQEVTFNSSGSYDPDGFIVNYAWDFGDGGSAISNYGLTQHVYITVGNYTVTQTVTDNDGLTGTASRLIIIRKLSVSIFIRASLTISIGENITLSGSLSPARAGTTVTVWYRLFSGPWTWLINVTTDTNGQWSHEWVPLGTGRYEFKASWPGDETTSSAETSPITVTVLFPYQTPYNELLITIQNLRENITKAQADIANTQADLDQAQNRIQALQAELSRSTTLQYVLLAIVIIQALSIILFILKRKTLVRKLGGRNLCTPDSSAR